MCDGGVECVDVLISFSSLSPHTHIASFRCLKVKSLHLLCLEYYLCSTHIFGVMFVVPLNHLYQPMVLY